MAEHVINRLEKLIPPSFVTVDTPDYKRILNHRTKLFKDELFTKHVELMCYEIDFLSGYIIRKGQQLRLEKALRLTNQVVKVAQRWKGNEFHEHLTKFRNAFKGGTLKGAAARVPSKQWVTWILYLMLRETALLAKMKLECEKSVPYWLGLIAKAHHWGDSLVITGILSRIWHLSSLLLCEIINKKYPAYVKLLEMVQPTQSSPWPDDNFKVPDDLYLWIRDTMKLAFEKARLFVNLSYFSRKPSSKDEIFSILSKTYDSKSTQTEGSQETSTQTGPSPCLDDEPALFLDTEGMPREEDFPYDFNPDLDQSEPEEEETEDVGVAVKEEEEGPPRKKRKRGRRKKSKAIDNSNQEMEEDADQVQVPEDLGVEVPDAEEGPPRKRKKRGKRKSAKHNNAE